MEKALLVIEVVFIFVGVIAAVINGVLAGRKFEANEDHGGFGLMTDFFDRNFYASVVAALGLVAILVSFVI